MSPGVLTGAQNAESRTAALFQQKPKMREEILKKIDRGDLDNIPGVAKEDLKAFVEGRPRPGGGLEAAGQETVRQRQLEAIVRRLGRPVLLIQNDTYVAPELPSVIDELAPHKQRIEAAIKRVGRVEFINHAMPWGGTGWLVDKNIVITNRHVAEIVAEASGNGKFRFKLSLGGVPFGARLDFKEEFGPAAAGTHEVLLKSVKFIARSDQPDIALLELKPNGALPDPLVLLDAASADGQSVGVIGYPAYDSRNDPQDIARYFGDIFDVKRFAPGLVSQQAGTQHFFMHDATTLGGNSGSVVIDLATGKALGLHFAGTYLEGNFAVTAAEIKKALSGLNATVTVPPEFASITEAVDGKHQPTFFNGRTGYDQNFLGSDNLAVPMLGLGTLEADAALPVDSTATTGKFLHYTHFSVAFSSSRRMPIFTAVNINGDEAKKIKRKNDKWFSDLRLPAAMQLTQEDYGDPDIDRGHMVRREDPNWGTLELAKVANDDTFHYTNAAPQHARLNQGKTQWLGLEEYVLSNAKTHGLSICVFTGPVLRDEDPSLDNGVQVPEEFWKVVVAIDEDTGKLRSTGYVLSQGKLIEDITEAFVFGQYRTYQVPVSTIQEATGLDFKGLVAADALKQHPLPEAPGGKPPVIPLEQLENMVL
jgi:endonuclease G, mitochondrial